MTHKPTCDQWPSKNPAPGGSRLEAGKPSHKPTISDEMLVKWQRIVDLLSKIFEARSVLILRLDPPQLEVLAASMAGGNPYKAGCKAELGSGLYCEKVMAQCRPLVVRNALAEPEWHGTPQLEFDMLFYVGFPLFWPDSEIFGTICVMDDKQNASAIRNQDLIFQFKEVVEADLVFLAEASERRKAEEALKESESMLRAILDASPVGIGLLKNRTIHWANKALHSTLGYKEGALVEKSTRGLYPDRHEYDRVGAALYLMIQEKGFGQLEIQFIAKDGSSIRCDLRARALDVFDPSKGIIIAAMDLTERKRAEAQIETLAHQLLTAQEEERQMISRELHDRLAQELSSLKIGLDTLFVGCADPAAEWRDRVMGLSQSLQNAISAVRDLSYELRPPALNDLGLVQAVFQYCVEFQEKTGVQVDFFSAGIDEKRLDPDTEINLYRMVQEALNNIRKHAEAGNAVVRLVACSPNVILRIEDDGKGFDVKRRLALLTTERRMGLRSIEERVKHLKGRMTLRSTPGRGTRVMVELPLKEKPDGSKKDHIDR
jgi:PAS domain S-box-containing protein